MNYAVAYVGAYIESARHLCQEMLGHYAEVSSISVPVPCYRGFHVRPSTLISKLVLHYGSSVSMEIGEEKYDASVPLELFRANEQINCRKRRIIADLIEKMKLVPSKCASRDVAGVVKKIVLDLAEQGKVILYEQPLVIPDIPEIRDEPLFNKVIAEIAWLQALGKIDIEAKFDIIFVGDTRVLDDIKLLAQTGYGEDKFGNNIELPGELKYLRK